MGEPVFIRATCSYCTTKSKNLGLLAMQLHSSVTFQQRQRQWKLLILKMKTTTKTMKQPTTTKTRTTTKPIWTRETTYGKPFFIKKKRFSFRIVTPINLPLPEQFQVFYCPYFVEHLMFTQCSPRWFSSHCQYLGFFLDPRFQRQYSCHCWRITFLQQDCCNGNWLLCKSPAMQLLQQLPRLIQHCHCLTASSNFLCSDWSL